MDIHVEKTLDIIRNSLFLATNLEDVEGLLKIGCVEKAIFARGSRRLRKYCTDNVYIHEDELGCRDSTISQIFPSIHSKVSKLTSNTPYIWTFRPYQWLDQFEALGVKPISWNYHLYTYWSSKLLQDKLLIKQSDLFLEKHLRKKHRKLQRNFLTASNVERQKSGTVLSKSYSTAGQGIYLNSKGNEFNEDFVLREEKIVKPHIPICQVAFTDGDSVLTYPTSIMIIKTKNGHFDYIGSDFSKKINISKDKEDEITKITRAVGFALSKSGFSGVYNCDYIYNPEDNELYFAEVNPRNSGCSFLIDSSLADRYNDGCADSIWKMPSFLSFYLSIYGKIPKYLNKNLLFENVFSKNSASSFQYIYASVDKEISIYEEDDFLPPNKIKVKKNQLLMTKCYIDSLIDDPHPPATLKDFGEKYYLPPEVEFD